MQNIIEQFSATNKANLQALESFTNQAFAGVEKLVELNLAASKAMLGESFHHAQATLSAKDAQEFMALQTSMLQPLADKTAAYAQHVQAIVTDSSAELSKALEAKSAEAQKAFGGVVENLSKNAPAGTEAAVAAFKNALTAGQSALESAQASAKKSVEVAQSNFSAATKQATDAAKKAAKAA
ncbi:MAG: phasin family protein [Gammaproteobacteria bacterium]|uniref:phasin family protein n=1 Tax=Rhodoferax sp. TaxID=50421 RepID=UPI001790E3DD|nr:phasin family protein [Rhodoferax sp.]MBU3898904.1 phasin family protein [Gammaproteobacteria bacterium]MBA3059525.1 phasin family protein [Rhodoferax sp.]MBU3998168.1 phasin family protein [Gammaproteobacteria bacterium]MBU4019380.1 phasin family protein [Gammaproteobacteria bacterium]MBU4081944.1 phasin family protein [Gammaproteobacteria bacterium]